MNEHGGKLVVRAVELGASGFVVARGRPAQTIVSDSSGGGSRCQREDLVDALVGDELRDLRHPLLPEIPVALVDLRDVAAERTALVRGLASGEGREVLFRDGRRAGKRRVDAVDADVPAGLALRRGKRILRQCKCDTESESDSQPGCPRTCQRRALAKGNGG